ncbi:glycosyl transferase [Microbacterium fluvii]|uniref:Glycosyl transferase n=1 Tax=Microbacterium fluvii TaxID=415215 RepID=A0ABW2HCT0_9MICO|nr:glycosyl transferase [Microbacterium fluvii]MCU4672546.1 glycosyl transferase [Microbacterium fluvii]
MRFVWAVAAFVLAALLIGAGIAQRTVFQGDTETTAAVAVEEGTPFVLIDGAALNAVPGAQTLRAQGEGTIFAAYGRTADVQAWLADSDYTAVTAGADGTLASALVTAPAPESTDAAGEESAAPTDEAAQAQGRDPVGSDLWLDEFQQDDVLIAPLQLPTDMSLLIATDGTAAAPTDITITWPIANPTPWAGPLIVLGGILMALGVFLYILGIRHVRRSRGPRRKGLPVPVTEPIDLSVEQADKGVISATRRGRAITGGKRPFALVPIALVSALALSGCSADAWPQFGSTPTATPTTTLVPEGQQAPAVTQAQASRILQEVSETIAAADEAMDASQLAERAGGAVLAVRKTNYTLRDEIDDYDAPAAIPTKPVEILLPQAYDAWPRTFMAVVNDAEAKTANIMMLTQDDPWSNYKLVYSANLEAATEMPALAPEYVGASAVPPDSSFLLLAPQDVAGAYADILTKGEKSEYYGLFDADTDMFRQSVAEDRAQRLEDFEKTGEDTGKLSFSSAAGPESPVSLATLESGAIVAVTTHETDIAKPTDSAAVIKLPKNPTVATLAGKTQSATGFTTTFSDQLFFYVPGQGSNEKIQLLGYSSDILGAKVIDK